MRNPEELTRPPADEVSGARSGSDADRAFLLECRLEQMRANVDEARAQAHRARDLLAEAAAREADHARRHQVLHEELAAAREEVAALHRRLEHSEALRAGLEGRSFESAASEDGRELVRLRGEAAASRDVAIARQRTVTDLRTRVEELVASRETLLSRVAEWQCAVRAGDPDAIDLGEFIAALRHDILELEHRSLTAERREADLREQLRLAGAQAHADSSSADCATETSPQPSDAPATEAGPQPPDSPTAETEPQPSEPPAADAGPQRSDSPGSAHEPETAVDGAAPPASGDDAQSRIDALLRLGRSGAAEAFYEIRSSLVAPEPQVRAAAYQALGHLLEHDPARLTPHIRWGIADADPRVRRRVVLAAAAARGLGLRPLLDPLRADPDAQVRRVVHEVLRRAPPASDGEAGVPAAELAQGS